MSDWLIFLIGLLVGLMLGPPLFVFVLSVIDEHNPRTPM